MAKELLVAAGGFRCRLGIGLVLLGFSPGPPSLSNGVALFLQPGKDIEGAAMCGDVEQPVLLHLALDLDQRFAESPQQRDRGRLVIDEGPAPS